MGTSLLTPFLINLISRTLGSVLDILPFTSAHLSTSIHLQVPPAPTNGQPEGHRDIPPPVRGVPGPGRVQDPHHVDVAYQGIVDYHPHPLVGVSNSHLSATDPPFDLWHLGNRTLHMYSPM
jgi:hypothetical protein